MRGQSLRPRVHGAGGWGWGLEQSQEMSILTAWRIWKKKKSQCSAHLIMQILEGVFSPRSSTTWKQRSQIKLFKTCKSNLNQATALVHVECFEATAFTLKNTKNAAQKLPKTEDPGMACMAYCPVRCNHGAEAGSSQQLAPQRTSLLLLLLGDN